MVYSTEASARAIAPVKVVIDSFLNDAKERLPFDDDGAINYHSQGRFVSLLLSIAQKKNCDDVPNSHSIQGEHVDWSPIDFLPSHRYVHKLVQRYTFQLEERSIELEDDNLVALV